MNDLVFVMYNLKLRQRNAKGSSFIRPPICLDDLPFDDKWIIDREPPTPLTTSNWSGMLERAARKVARDASDDENYGSANVGIVRNACE